MLQDSGNQELNAEDIQKEIFEKVTASPQRLTPLQLEKTISRTYGLDKTRARALLSDLVAGRRLEYTYEFGSTFLVPSFNRPVRVSAHVVVTPPQHRYQPAPDEVAIQIRPGAAFGGGRHPTTRLSLGAIEFISKEERPAWLNENSFLLDIGTGSGILAIAAVCLGIKKGLALDIDPCAVAEAKENIALNRLAERLFVSGRRLETIRLSFSMVIANLRYPSLKQFYPRVKRLTGTGGRVILSGFRPGERESLLALYSSEQFECIWADEELNWSAVVLKNKGHASSL